MNELPPRDETRKLIVGEIALADRAVRNAARTLTLHLPDDTKRIVTTLAAARESWAWTFDLHAKLPFWSCCDAIGVNAEEQREFMLSRLDDNMRRIVIGKYGYKCPVCDRFKEKKG